MKNRKLLLIVSLVLALTMSLGGTLAYLTDTDADVNTMVLGNVSIENREFERRDEDGDGKLDTLNCEYRNNELSYKLYPYSQDKRLVPAVGEAKVYDDTKVCFAQFGEKHALGRMDVFKQDELKNVQDKFVFVENTGKSDAYIRTYLAFEIGNAENAMGIEGGAQNNLIMALTNNFWDEKEVGNVSINGNNYYVLEYVYAGSNGDNGRHPDGIVHPGDYTYNNLAQVYITPKATNEDLLALDGNGNGKLDILVLSQAIQADGFANAEVALNTGFGEASVEKVQEWFGDVTPKYVTNIDELQSELDKAVDGTTIVFANDIVGDVTVTQKPGVKVTLDGNNYALNGYIVVDGKSGTYTTAGLNIKNIVFDAETIGADACIRLGNGTNATRYTCNVTVENCTFDVSGAVGVKSYTGGDKNVTIKGCYASENCHSLCQLKGVDGVLVQTCEVRSKNGLNFNNSNNVVVHDCLVDVKGYALRFGESANSVVENYTITNNDLRSANDDGDAVVVFRAGAVDAEVVWSDNTLTAAEGIEYTGEENVIFK